MSPTPGRRSETKPRPARPKPAKPWQRAEAGRHRSGDGRFTLESDGGGRWFVTDSEELDELGLARTSGPFPTLAAAKAVADVVRARPAATSPLAARMAEAATRPKDEARAARGTNAPDRGAGPERGRAAGPERGPAAGPGTAPPRRTPEPAQPHTWIDDLAEADVHAATRARALVRRLEREGVRDADALVRRDVLGDRAAIATHLLARDVLAAIARLGDPSAADVAEAVAGVLASSPKRAGLPGWELLERDGAGDGRRAIRLTSEDLLLAAKDMDSDTA